MTVKTIKVIDSQTKDEVFVYECQHSDDAGITSYLLYCVTAIMESDMSYEDKIKAIVNTAMGNGEVEMQDFMDRFIVQCIEDEVGNAVEVKDLFI